MVNLHHYQGQNGTLGTLQINRITSTGCISNSTISQNKLINVFGKCSVVKVITYRFPDSVIFSNQRNQRHQHQAPSEIVSSTCANKRNMVFQLHYSIFYVTCIVSSFGSFHYSFKEHLTHPRSSVCRQLLHCDTNS